MQAPRTAAAAAALVAALALLAPAAADAASLRSRLAAKMRPAGRYSGAYVYNATLGRAVLRWRERRPRILASNTKLFTTAAALARYGHRGTLGTEVRGSGSLDAQGVWHGNLYLWGGGDPTFGSRRFVRRNYGSGATVEALATRVKEAGIASVTGRVYGDESRFDSLRGGPSSGYGTSIWVGPLSALSFNHGLANASGSAFQTKPPLTAARRLDAALERRGIRVAKSPRRGRTPAAAGVIASVDSPPMESLVRLTNKPSDNFFAEMLLKDLALRATGKGTTRRGARIATRFARAVGSRVQLVDGSGLSRSDRASPYRLTRLLLAMLRRDEFQAFYASLPRAGQDGTLARRMRRGPARARCRAKTGTLSNVSSLSGYCLARSGNLYAFSILMNGVSVTAARRLQDGMAHALAGVTNQSAPVAAPRR
jgi:D-alanyl-D-alanine carboxypeptidase/D-alanyl-D-alanine-endopeptidase (penicillin-binding protein 4)